jgi:adhesin/invasin
MSAHSEPGFTYPSYLSGVLKCSKRLSALVWMFVSMLVFSTGVSAFVPGTGNPPGVPDLTHPNTKLSITKNNSVADGVDQNIVVAHIVDNLGNPVPNVSVSFIIIGNTGGNPVFTTDASGNAYFPFINYDVGTVSVTAKVGAASISGGVPVSTFFVAGPPDLIVPETRLTVEADNAIANGAAKNIVRAHIEDAFGHPLSGQTIVFTIAGGTANFVGSNTIITDVNGNADISLISIVAGQVNVTATVNTVNIPNGSPATVTFVADAPSASNPATALSVVTNNALADGVATNSVKAHVVDANGNPVANQIVTFTIATGTAAFTGGATVTTDANGDAVVTLKSNTVGTVDITATVNTITITNGSPAKVNFVAGPPDVTNSTTRLQVTADNAIANGIAVNTVRARIRDAFGNAVKNATVVFTIVSGNGTFVTSTTVLSSSGGNASVSLTSLVAGQVSITATVNGVPIVNGSPAIVTFVADAPSTANPATELTVITDFATANNISTNSVNAHIVDANGNPVPNATIVFTIANGTASFVGGVNTVTTDINGDAIIKLTSTVAGTVDITATVDGTPIVNGSPATITFVVDVPSTVNPATALIVVVTGSVADGIATNSVRAHIVDGFGNPVANQSITFTIASGTANFVGGVFTFTTDANGDAVVQLTSTVAGPVDITATVNGTAIVNGSPATVIFTSDAPTTGNPATALSVVNNNAVADGSARNSVKAHVVDVNGNPVAGQAVVFTIATGTGTLVGSGTVVTDANGDAIIELTSTVTGDVDITATINGNPILTGSPATVTFVADAPSVNNPATALSVVTNNALADGIATNSVKAHIVDANGNPVPNATIVFNIISGTGVFVGTSTVITDANGDAVIQLQSTVAGNVQVTATVNGTAITNGSPATVTFISGTSNPGNPATALSVVINNAPADGYSVNSVKAHIADINGNPVANATVVFTIASGTANFASTATVTTDANGDAIVTLTSTVIGSVDITATVDGSPIPNGSPATVFFVVGAPDVTNPGTMLSVVADNALADGAATNRVLAHIVDAQGHPVPNATIVFAIASGTANFVGSVTIVTDANGNAFIDLNSIVSGKVNITATVNGTAIVNGSPAIVTFTAGAPSVNNPATALSVVTNNAQANGTATNSVKAHIADANGNPVPNATVTFTIANGTGTFVGTATVTTDANGDAVIGITSTVGGNVEITATVNTVPLINGSPAVVTFTTDPDVTRPETQLIVVANDAIADGVATNSVKAHVVDATGTPLGLKEVFFKIDAGNATVLTVQPVLTDANGDATIQLSSTTPGNVLVTAKVQDKPIVFGSPAKLRFVPIDIYVPRVFTPNNDGKNDDVKPILVGISTFHYFSIYNRWGNLVYTTKDPNAGWDGRFKGVLQPVETYLWIAEGLDKDKKKVTRRGMISLVR